MRALLRVLRRSFHVKDRDAPKPAVGLLADHAPQALDHLATRSAAREDDREVRIRDVNAFVEQLRSGDEWVRPISERVERILSLGGAQACMERPAADARRLRDLDGPLGGLPRLREENRRVGGLDRRGELAQVPELGLGGGEDLAPLGEGTQVESRLPRPVPPGLAEPLGLAHKHPERLRGQPVLADQDSPFAPGLVVGLEIPRKLRSLELDADERDLEVRDDVVHQRLAVSEAVTVRPEVRIKDRRNAVVVALVGSGQAEASIEAVLERRRPHLRAVVMDLVGDEETARRGEPQQVLAGCLHGGD